MAPAEIDRLVARLLPSVLADRDLGDGRSFTALHLRNLWALSCLHAGECYDEDLLLDLVERHLPRTVMLTCEIHARSA